MYHDPAISFAAQPAIVVVAGHEEVDAVRGLIVRFERRERGRCRSGRHRMHRHRDDLSHFAQVLGGSSEEELIFSAVWST